MRSLVAALAVAVAACGGTSVIDIDLAYDPGNTCGCAFEDVQFTAGADIILDIVTQDDRLVAFGCGGGSNLDQLAAALDAIDYGNLGEDEFIVFVEIFSPPILTDFVSCAIGGQPQTAMFGSSNVIDPTSDDVITVPVACIEPPIDFCAN